MEFEISTRAIGYFDRAGFHPTRDVPVNPDVPRSHPAYRLLLRFGGLRVGVGLDGEMLEEIRNDIAFLHTEPYGQIKEWERILRTRLVGVAETHHRHGLLFLSDDERFFTLSGMHDAMGFEGCGFMTAIDNLLFGRSMPMIRPDQSSVSWYGIEYAPGDPGLYRYHEASA